MTSNKEIATDLYPIIRLYKDGTVQRLISSPYMPPSPSDPLTGVSSKDITISSTISARLYLPKLPPQPPPQQSSPKLPILIYFHGGGFCIESAFAASHHPYLNSLVSRATVLAVSIEYRLAPEHPLPAGYDDCWAAINWVASHNSTITTQLISSTTELEKVKVNTHADLPSLKRQRQQRDCSGNNNSESSWLNEYGAFDRVYIGGDSSGANMVHNMAMRAGVECIVNGVKILGAFLSHPFFLESKTSDTDDGLDLAEKLWLFVYPDVEGGVDSPMINPFADGAPSLRGLGCRKMLVVVSENDLGRGKGVKYYEGVKKSGWGGEVELIDVQGEGHCFHAHNPDSEKARILIRQMADFIK